MSRRSRRTAAAIALLAAFAVVPAIVGSAVARADSAWGSDPVTGTVTPPTPPAGTDATAPTTPPPVAPDDSAWG